MKIAIVARERRLTSMGESGEVKQRFGSTAEKVTPASREKA